MASTTSGLLEDIRQAPKGKNPAEIVPPKQSSSKEYCGFNPGFLNSGGSSRANEQQKNNQKRLHISAAEVNAKKITSIFGGRITFTDELSAPKGAAPFGLYIRADNDMYWHIDTDNMFNGFLREELAAVQADYSSDKMDCFKKSCLNHAAMCNYPGSVKYLLNQGASADASFFEKRTPLHLACIYAASQVVPLLITPENINARDCYGGTPLSNAIERKQFSVAMQLLQEENVDANLAQEDGITPLVLALGHFDPNNPERSRVQDSIQGVRLSNLIKALITRGAQLDQKWSAEDNELSARDMGKAICLFEFNQSHKAGELRGRFIDSCDEKVELIRILQGSPRDSSSAAFTPSP